MEDKTTCYAALGDATRMHILRVISQNSRMRAKDILEHLDISQPTLSHHMRLLGEEKLVSSVKVGRECFYSVNQQTISDMVEDLLELSGRKKKSGKVLESFDSLYADDKKKKSKDKKEKKKKKKDKNK